MANFVRTSIAAALMSALLASAAASSELLEETLLEETSGADAAATSASAESTAEDTAADGEESDGQDGDTGDASGGSQGDDAPAPAPSRNFGNLSKLQIHGFLTQAYATSDFVSGRIPDPTGVDPGPTFNEIALGIPEDGTFEYWTIALQFRYEITPRDIMVVQFSSRALGDSPISELEDEVELDWAFYERRLADHTSLKVGRVQIPLGIFNEIRDVGTILPFYRPPFLFYREGTFTNETVDGVVLSHTFMPESDWTLEADLFVGDWETFEFTPLGDERATIANDQGYGAQLWLNTPLPGLRFGYGIHWRDRTEGAEGVIRLPGATTNFLDWYASVEAAFEKVVFRAEWRQFSGDREVSPALQADDFFSNIDNYYAQIGYHFTERFRIYAQYEKSDSSLHASIFTNGFDVSLEEDYALAVNYLFSPNLVLKAEHHIVEGEDFSFVPDFTNGFRLRPFTKDLESGNRTILSLSVSF